jgi:prolipoprotein diacylglyceryltransferase
VHPAQLYSALNGLILCGVALAFYPFRQRHGQVIALLLTLYAITRFMEERIRIDEQALLASLTMSEAISVGLAIAMSLLWMYIASQPRIGDT